MNSEKCECGGHQLRAVSNIENHFLYAFIFLPATVPLFISECHTTADIFGSYNPGNYGLSFSWGLWWFKASIPQYTSLLF